MMEQSTIQTPFEGILCACDKVARQVKKDVAAQ
jgi:hypothetical protein